MQIQQLSITWPLAKPSRVAPHSPSPVEQRPQALSAASGPTTCNLSFRQLPVVPGSSIRWDDTRLLHLYLNDNRLTALPDAIGRLRSLFQLFIHNNQLRALPTTIGQLRSLWELDLHANRLTSLPNSVCKLSSLRRIDMTGNLFSLTTSTAWISRLRSLDLDPSRSPGLLLPPKSAVEDGIEAVRTQFAQLETQAALTIQARPTSVGIVMRPARDRLREKKAAAATKAAAAKAATAKAAAKSKAKARPNFPEDVLKEGALLDFILSSEEYPDLTASKAAVKNSCERAERKAGRCCLGRQSHQHGWR